MVRNNKRGAHRTCSICGETRLRLYFAFSAFVYLRCRSCGLIQMGLLPVNLPPGDDYVGYDLERQRKFLRVFFGPRYRKALQLIKQYRKGGRLLDVGCGTGEFLDEAVAAGFSVLGVEPSTTAFLIARTRHPVVHGELGDVGLSEDSFDVVTLWSVLEHVLDPFSFLDRVRFILKRGGILALRLPSSRGLLPRAARWLYRASGGLVKRPLVVIYQLDWHYKHFYSYNPENLALLLRKSGFEILRHEEEASFNLPSLDLRMDYLPRSPLLRLLLKAALSGLLCLSRLLHRQDEMVVLARKTA